MLNEFVYCPRLFYYEHVEGVFVENADTLRGAALHRRVDSGNGAMPAARRAAASKADTTGATAEETETDVRPEPETIHSRSVQMGSVRLGVVAKMDLVETRPVPAPGGQADLFDVVEVCPVDYKAGAPRDGESGIELWDTDRMQLGLQALILRDNGYVCREGVIYYRATRQRVRLEITPALEDWIIGRIAEARLVMKGPIPAPLENSPKCVRCSLAPVCLPDETRLLGQAGDVGVPADGDVREEPRPLSRGGLATRRLMAPRDERRALYLNSQGFRVGCKGDVLQVKDGDKLVEEVRIRDVTHVALLGNIQVSTQAVRNLCEHEVPLTYFSMGGWFYGITRGHALKNVFLRMEQFRLAGDDAVCLALARRFVFGKIRNHRTLLMRNHAEPPQPVILKLRRASKDALAAGSIDELLGIEGAAARLYFSEFNGMIKATDEVPEPEEPEGPDAGTSTARPLVFSLDGRNRRPPTDPVNAMLSFAYSLLSKDCTLAALAVGFDPYLGFYHRPRFGRPALGLDIMEEFRPLVAESTVLSCINNRVVTDRDFVRAGEAVNLSAAGRKRFLQMYEQRMCALITHPLFDYKVSYRRALELQARILARVLTGEIPEYIPMLTR